MLRMRKSAAYWSGEMTENKTSLPEYSNPPLIEVVCGVSFAPLSQFKSVHVGQFWERVKSELPVVEEHPPIATVIESLDGLKTLGTDIQLSDMPPLPRAWFIDNTGNRLIQIQNDIFLHNWRKLSPTDRYPRYKEVYRGFIDYFGRFQTFVNEFSVGSISPTQFELTYINHISLREFGSTDSLLTELFPDFSWRVSEKRFLPRYENVNWRSSFRLPGNQGRLHISIQSAYRRPDNEPLIVLELKARGIGSDLSESGLQTWFDTAHEWIVCGFADITGSVAQTKLWGRKE